jgi:hypothetical protein
MRGVFCADSTKAESSKQNAEMANPPLNGTERRPIRVFSLAFT